MTLTFLQGIVPARFLILISHLTIVLMILWGVDEVVRRDMPLLLSEAEFSKRRDTLSIGLYLSISLIAIELISFLSGISLFWPLISFISMAFHSFGSISLSYFIIHKWHPELYWLIFIVSNIIPITGELFVILGVLVFKK